MLRGENKLIKGGSRMAWKADLAPGWAISERTSPASYQSRLSPVLPHPLACIDGVMIFATGRFRISPLSDIEIKSRARHVNALDLLLRL
jgi:hypothetical protein